MAGMMFPAISGERERRRGVSEENSGREEERLGRRDECRSVEAARDFHRWRKSESVIRTLDLEPGLRLDPVGE